MIENTGFAAFNLYHSLRLHFKGSYDYIKYGGKTTMSQDKFLLRADKFFFYRLSRKYNFEELKNFYIANFLENVDIRPGPLELENAQEIYKKWLSVATSLRYLFKNDITYLIENYNIESVLKVRSGQYPILLELVMQGDIHRETLIILNEILNFFPMWKEKISDDVIWPSLELKYKKYVPFLNIDKQTFKSIIKDVMRENI